MPSDTTTSDNSQSSEAGAAGATAGGSPAANSSTVPPGGADAAEKPPETTHAGESSGGEGGEQQKSESRGGDSGRSAPLPRERQRDWRDDRIDKLTAKIKESAEREKQLQQQPAGTAGTTPTTVAPLPEDEINRRAQTLAQQQMFREHCIQVENAGKAAYKDFQDRAQAFARLVDPTDLQQNSGYMSLLQAAMKTGQAHHIVHKLSSDPQEAIRLISLPPMDQAFEIAKMSQANGNADVSLAPKPITPVNNGTGRGTAIDPADPERASTLSTAEWMERRQKQVVERRRAGARR